MRKRARSADRRSTSIVQQNSEFCELVQAIIHSMSFLFRFLGIGEATLGEAFTAHLHTYFYRKKRDLKYIIEPTNKHRSILKAKSHRFESQETIVSQALTYSGQGTHKTNDARE